MTISEDQILSELLDVIRAGIYGPDWAWAIQNVGPPIGVAVAVLRWVSRQITQDAAARETDLSEDLWAALAAVREDEA